MLNLEIAATVTLNAPSAMPVVEEVPLGKLQPIGLAANRKLTVIRAARFSGRALHVVGSGILQTHSLICVQLSS